MRPDPQSVSALCFRYAANLHQIAPTSIFDLSVKRDRRNGVESTLAAPPATRSAARWPMPGPAPKPCPEQPAATNTPPMLPTGEITGIASGVESTYPPQEDTMPASATAGNR